MGVQQNSIADIAFFRAKIINAFLVVRKDEETGKIYFAEHVEDHGLVCGSGRGLDGEGVTLQAGIILGIVGKRRIMNCIPDFPE